MRNWVTRIVDNRADLRTEHTCWEYGLACRVLTGVIRGGVAHVAIGITNCHRPEMFTADFFQGSTEGAWFGDSALLESVVSNLGDLPADAAALVHEVRNMIKSGGLREMGTILPGVEVASSASAHGQARESYRNDDFARWG